ncbi:hypothetical protein HO173_005043 [Letharia columbiana]|uniref:SNF2 family helicase n=1 Tax=Letharia columbiana TaxID=112416 RepID=A0A8H6L5Y2_9LECA|nr:uncharacterized protein HO173_005043 [Letharia columbiana]KAF6236752.1 hypothetical protein HO173_005043 [Letharia columbiana]
MAPRTHGKRKIDAIDLTGDDDVGSASWAHRAPPGDVTQSQRNSWMEQGDEADAEDIVISSQDGEDSVYQSYQLYGNLDTKIVGVQYYTGHATPGEHVIVRREPNNPYDSNALRVENVQRAQIGHIPRTMASKLAKYMDSGALLVEGSLSGHVGSYDCPIALKLFGTSEPVERANLRSQMKADSLPSAVIDQKEKEAKKRKAEELKKIAAAKKGKGGKTGGGGQQWGHSSQTDYAGTLSQGDGNSSQSFEDLIDGSERFNPREVGSVVEKFGAGEDALAAMPMAECPKKLTTQLLPYQRQALAWLLEKENPQLPSAGSDDAVQLWKCSRNGQIYTNVATSFSLKNQKPTLASGGILSDDMGMGKTIEMISLIASDNADSTVSSKSKTTLIIAPVGVMSNWSGQIAHHIKPDHALRVLVYHGHNKKPMKAEDFGEYDVVITSYGTLATEYFPRGKKDPPSVPRQQGLFSTEWRRVILDEGHIIRNPQTKSALAALNLMAQSRWVLTGTPIINNLKDLFSLVRFIGLTGGLERLEIFNSVLIRPLNQGDINASLLLQALMATICLRRKKEMKFVDLKLPELSEYVHRIDFLDHEKEKYEALQAEAKGLLHTVQRNQTNSNGKGQDTYRHLLEMLLRLRQVCNHWKLCGERVNSVLSVLESQKVVDLTPENRKALQDMLQVSIESREDCPICLENLHNPVITACAHVFGADCIERVIETQHRCPMCRAEPLELESLVRPAVDLGETSDQPDIDTDTSSSKVEALLSILKASSKKPGTKTVIFSQWTSFLNIIQAQLDANGYKYARIDGTMRANERDASLTALETNPECTVMLASLAVCSVGLNLVAANQVILADSWWAPAIEDQAVDRVHRLGQKKPTTVWRLVMNDSIEDQVLNIQAEKRKLMMTAFQEKTGKRMKEGSTARMGDIERLLR